MKNFLVENFLWLQNHFFGNRFEPKLFRSKIFYGCKIISLKTGLNQKFFDLKFFMVAKSFPREQDWTKIFINNSVFQNVLCLENHFLEDRFLQNILIKNCLVENFLWLQNHFLENRFELKITINIFWSKNFYGCNIISSKTGLNQNFSSKIFWLKIFYGCKIISSKTGLNQNFS